MRCRGECDLQLACRVRLETQQGPRTSFVALSCACKRAHAARHRQNKTFTRKRVCVEVFRKGGMFRSDESLGKAKFALNQLLAHSKVHLSAGLDERSNTNVLGLGGAARTPTNKGMMKVTLELRTPLATPEITLVARKELVVDGYGGVAPSSGGRSAVRSSPGPSRSAPARPAARSTARSAARAGAGGGAGAGAGGGAVASPAKKVPIPDGIPMEAVKDPFDIRLIVSHDVATAEIEAAKKSGDLARQVSLEGRVMVFQQAVDRGDLTIHQCVACSRL